MIETEWFCDSIDDFISFYAGVPDSLLKDFCACISNRKSAENHIIAANEGNAVALAAGHFLATGKPACVYLQNSGQGNIINPLLSLADKAVYRVPMLFIIGWRGEPGIKDEPQHVTQGELTLPLLDTLGMNYAVLDKDSDRTNVETIIKQARAELDRELPFVLVVKKGSFSSCRLDNEEPQISRLKREDAISILLEVLPDEYRIISTTGKTSRELFELREQRQESHYKDFLTVGSMGHTSQIALGAALSRQDTPICCLDGDGSVLMHMGSLAVNGSRSGTTMLHVVFNNAAHDSVGGQPTVMNTVNIPAVAEACGYTAAHSCDSGEELRNILQQHLPRPKGMVFIEVKVARGSRDDLGRPTISALDCRLNFQRGLKD